MSTPHYDPAQFFADLMKSGQDQMQKMMSGAPWAGMPAGAPGAPDFAAQIAAAGQQFSAMQQQYLANLSRMTGAPGGGVPDMSAQMAAVTKQFTDLQQQYLAGLQKLTAMPAGASDVSAQMAAITKQFTDLQQQYAANVQKMTAAPAALPDMSAQMAAATKQFTDMQQQYLSTMQNMAGAWATPAGAAPAAVDDKRFAGEAWSKDPRFDAVRKMYLAYASFIEKAIDAAPVDEREKGQLRFAGRQFVDAMSPANFFATNPEAIQLAMETGGASVNEGMKRFFEDFAKGRITTTDESMFEVGRNIAVTPGSVVFENDLIQLIQYTPTTEKVYERPLVIVPPCINKFYILDLQPENSFVAHAVGQGNTVFVVSWRNVKADLGTKTWDDYLREGPMKAIDVALDITGADQTNTLGFCVGGTLLASAAAVMKTNEDEKISSMTLLTSMLDFTDTGEIGLLIDEKSVEGREASIGKGGLLQGKELGFVFSSLRANDLIWPYVVNSYLKGQGPPAFDLLYWNSDATNLPGPMFCWYVRHTYLQNDLRVPGKTIQCDVPVDLGDIDFPTYVYASREDHIVPWKTAYESTRLLRGENRFVLGASGHIAGVINPPSKNKRNYWAGGPEGSDPETWLTGAQKIPGSWWPDWSAWLARNAGEQVPAPKSPGTAKYRVIEPAPGRYVKEKAE
jgi:polyhydroxyalkanoate synthase